MKKTDQHGFNIVEALIIIFVIAILGGIGWFMWQKQHKTEQKSATTSQEKKSNSSTSTTKAASIPADYLTYTDSTNKFDVSYPKSWGEMAAPDTNSSATPYIDQLAFGSKSRLSNRLTAVAMSKDGFDMIVKKYGATVKPVEQNGKTAWEVSDVNPADKTDKVGDIYPIESFKNANGVTVYDFTSDDEGISQAAWIFVSHDNYIVLRLPYFMTYDATTSDPAPTLQADLDLYHALAKKIADTIQVK